MTRLSTAALAALITAGSFAALVISGDADDAIVGVPGEGSVGEWGLGGTTAMCGVMPCFYLHDPRIASTDVLEVCATDGLPGSAYSRRHRVIARRPVPGYQIDHIVPLCLGGADTDADIQIQPIDAAIEKDELERSACRAVCAVALDLGETQRFFIERWGGSKVSLAGIGGPERFVYTCYARDKDTSSDQGVDNRGDRRDTRPPVYLAVLIGICGFVGFILSCIGLNGDGNALYLFGGWGIAAGAVSSLVWWWV